METKHNFFKNYRTIINRSNELKPTELRANGTYAAAWKEEGNPDTQWGIIVLEDHKIKYCYNLLAKDIWMGFPIDEKVTIDMHIFEATNQEVEMAELYMETISLDSSYQVLDKHYVQTLRDMCAIVESKWYKLGKFLHLV